MNVVDLSLGILLALCALRGYWRGFLRECFGIIAVIGGIAAAFRFTALGAVMLERYATLPDAAHAGVAFVAIFVLVYCSFNVVGFALDRAARTRLLRGINHAGGAMFGVGKGAVVLSLLLLFLHLFPLVPKLDAEIMDSRIGRPMVAAAGDALRLGIRASAEPAAPRRP